MKHARERVKGVNRAHASCTWSLDAAAAPPSPAPPGRLRCRGTGGTAPANAVSRAYVRDGRRDPEITVIDLRRQYIPDDQDPDEGSGPGRRYRHRWVVSAELDPRLGEGQRLAAMISAELHLVRALKRTFGVPCQGGRKR
ncbi:hypothetical protein [Streptomyces synnematoformans]|uniref:Transposase n=1 Tax=Streptomyces synnematoformans TaxID=415721 RepID=A0ABN2XXP7_9ACTN